MRRRSRDRNASGRPIATPEEGRRLAWWSEARFGMFVHWGLYSIPAGKWEGNDVPGIAEWIMHRARIPVEQYEALAPQFNPIKFDAKRWASLAKKAGMKYLVITSKHHDGFAIFDSPSSEYDIVDATPYGRDPVADLAEACKEAGIPLCFYYSQDQDWHESNASGNNWDFRDDERDFAAYLRDKVKPQVRELLTQYGPIGLIWFDTPILITKDQSEDLRAFVQGIQPDCLVSGRIGNGVGDYGSLGDNQIPAGRIDGFWETPATMNDSWGFKANDHSWKSAGAMLNLLADLASKGINYLLNIGPTAEGIVPDVSVRRLEEIGRWMDLNGDAIYGTSASPFAYGFDWGSMTQKGNTLYLMFSEWPGETFTLYGLRNKVHDARLLADPSQAIRLSQRRDEEVDNDVLELRLPTAAPDKYVSVVALDLDGPANVEPLPLQQPDGAVDLLATMADLHVPNRGSRISVSPGGVIQKWYNKRNWVSWKFKVNQPREFRVKVVTGTLRHLPDWIGGHRISVVVAGSVIDGEIRDDEKVETPQARYFPQVYTNLGRVRIDNPGTYVVKVRADKINQDAPSGLTLTSLRLE